MGSSPLITATLPEPSPSALQPTEESPVHDFDKSLGSSAVLSTQQAPNVSPEDRAPDTMPHIKQEPEYGGEGSEAAATSATTPVKEEPQDDVVSGGSSAHRFSAMPSAHVDIRQEHDESDEKLDFSKTYHFMHAPLPTIKEELQDYSDEIESDSVEEEDGDDEGTSSRVSSPPTSYSDTDEDGRPILDDDAVYEHFRQEKPVVIVVD